MARGPEPGVVWADEAPAGAAGGYAEGPEPGKTWADGGAVDFKEGPEPGIVWADSPAAAGAGGTSFMKSMGRGVDLMQSMLYGALEAGGEMAGLPETTRVGREGRVRNIDEAGAAGPRARFAEIKDAAAFGQWVKETVGEQIPMMAPSLAGAVAGGGLGALTGPAAPVAVPIGAAIGAFIPSAVLGTGEIQQAIKEKDPNAVAPGWAFAGGSAIGVLDSALPGKFGSTLVKAFGKEAAEEIAKKALSKPIKAEFLKRTAKGAAAGMAVEGLTEAVQEAIGEYSAARGAKQPVDVESLKGQALEAGAAGALMGLGVGGVTGAAARRPRQRPAEAAGEEPPAEEAAPAPAAAPPVSVPPVALVVEPEPAAPVQAAPAADAGAPAPPAGYVPLYDEDGKTRVGIVNMETGDIRMDVDRPVTSAPEDIEAARAETVQPTEAQKEAGNYRKPPIKFWDYDVRMETAAGQPRTGTTPDGATWSVDMPVDYGYISRTEAADGEQLDVFMGPDRGADQAYVIDQIDPATGEFDEPKAMLGFPTPEDAIAAYDASFSDGQGKIRRGAITPLNREQFADYVNSGDLTVALAYRPAAEKAAGAKPQSLATLARAMGGLKDPGGDLRSMDALRQRPGLLNNATGVDLDRFGERAFEMGFFNQRPTVAEVLEKLGEELSGRPVYTDNDQAEIVRRQEAAAEEDWVREADRLGIDYEGKESTESIRTKVLLERNRLQDLADSMETDVDGMIVSKLEKASPEEQAAYEAEVEDIPFPDLAPAKQPSPRGGADAARAVVARGPGDESRAAGSAGEAAGSDQAADEGDALDIPDFLRRKRQYRPDQEPRRPAAERAAGKPDTGRAERPQQRESGQALIPGVAPVTDKDKAEAKGKRPLRAKAPQKAADEGIFDTGARRQTDLVEEAKKPKPGLSETEIELAGDRFFRNDKTAERDISAAKDQHAAAMRYVLSKRDGNEHVVILRRGSAVAAGSTGQQDFVAFPTRLIDVVNHPDGDLIIHHNHPAGTALSNGDIGQFVRPGLTVAFAHGENGRSSAARLSPEMRAALDKAGATPAQNYNRLKEIVDTAGQSIYRTLYNHVSNGAIDRNDANKLHSDMVNRVLSSVGIIDYWTSHPEMQSRHYKAALVRAEKDVRNALKFRFPELRLHDRPAVTVRTAGDVAGILETDGKTPAKRRGGSGGGTSGAEGYQGAPSPGVDAKGQYRLLEERLPYGLSAGPPKYATRQTKLFGSSFDVPSTHVKAYFDDHNLTLIRRLWNSTKEAGRHARVKLQDNAYRLKQVQEIIQKTRGFIIDEAHDAYLAMEIWMGRAGKQLTDFRIDEIEPLIKKINEHGFTVEQTEEFLYARHAPERNARIARINPELPDGGSGMFPRSTDDPKGRPGYLDIFDKAKADGSFDKLEEIGQMVDRITRRTMRIRLALGLIDSVTHKLWTDTYKHYVPLRGFAEVDETDLLLADKTGKPRTGRGFDIRGEESKMALGRQSRAGELLATTFTMRNEAIIRGRKNEALGALVKLIQANPKPDLWEMDVVDYRAKLNRSTGLVEYGPATFRALRTDEVAVKVGGKVHYIRFHGDFGAQLLRIFTNASADSTSTIVHAFGRLNRYFAFVNTSLNPEFVVGNLLRDLQTAGINMTAQGAKGLQRRVFLDVPKAMAGAYGGLRGKRDTVWQKRYHQYAEAGGKIEFFGLDSIEDQRKKIDAKLKELDPTRARQILTLGKDLKQFIEDSNGAVENAIRLSLFHHLVASGVSEKKSASVVRNITVNFNRKGEWGTALNAFFLFYNASIQGSQVVIKSLHNKQVRRVVGSIVITTMLLDLINGMMSPKDDDGESKYDKINKWTKHHNLIFMNWWATDSKANPVALKIPLPYGFNVFSVLGYKMGEMIRGKSNPLEAAADVFKIALQSFNPLGGESDILDMVVPTVLKPYYELQVNKNFLGNPIKPTENPFDDTPKPESERYFRNVSTISKYMTKWMNDLTGGNAVRPGAIDISPESVDHFAAFVAGGAGAFVGRANDFVMKVARGEPVTWNNAIIARRLIEGENQYYDIGKYRDLKEAVGYVNKERKLFTSQKDTEALRTLREEHAPEYKMMDAIKATEKQLREIRKARNHTEQRRDISEGQKKDMLERLKTRETDEMRKALKRYRTLLDEAKAAKR